MKNNCVVIVDNVNQWNQFETDTIATNGEMTKDIVPYFKNEDNEGFDDDEIREIKDALSTQNDVSVLIKRDLDGKYFALSNGGEMSVQAFLDEAEVCELMITKVLMLIGGRNIRVIGSAELEQEKTAKCDASVAGRYSGNEEDGGEKHDASGLGGATFAKENKDRGAVHISGEWEDAKSQLDEAREYIRKYSWLQNSVFALILDGVEKGTLSGKIKRQYHRKFASKIQLKGAIDVMFKYSLIDADIKAKLEGELRDNKCIERTFSFELTLPTRQ